MLNQELEQEEVRQDQETPQVNELGFIEIDGGFWDPETGEEIKFLIPGGMEDAAKIAIGYIASADLKFKSAKERKADWETKRKTLDNRRKALRKRFGPLITDFARLIKTQRVVEVGYSTVEFNNSAKGSIEVFKEAAALKWCEENCPEAIVMKPEVSVAKLTPEARAKLMADFEKADDYGFEVSPPGEKIKIVTIKGLD